MTKRRISPSSPQLLAGAGAGLLLITSAILVYLYINQGYGELGEAGYEYATALYSICNQKDRARLDKLAEMLDAAKSQGQLGTEEARWIEQIISHGRLGDWETAQRHVRKLMMRQVEQS